MPRALFLGPEGTHTGEAAKSCDLLAGWELVPASGIRSTFERFVAGDAEAAVLPIENALEGPVGLTLDLLSASTDVRIRREIVRSISHALAVPRQAPLDPAALGAWVHAVLSHPQALAQCARNLERRFPAATLEPAPSTAEAARIAATRDHAVALSSPEAAAAHALIVREDDLSDEPGNRTRFVVLMHEDERPSGDDRTSIVFGLDRDRPGGLHGVLGELASRGINLSRIESRPTKQNLGEYVFFADLEAHREDRAAADALKAVEKRTAFFRILGSYPRAR